MYRIAFSSSSKKPTGSAIGRFVRGVLGLMILATLVFFSLSFVFVVVTVALVVALIFAIYVRIRYGKNFLQRWQMAQFAKRTKTRARFGDASEGPFTESADLADHIGKTNKRRGVTIDGEAIEVPSQRDRDG